MYALHYAEFKTNAQGCLYYPAEIKIQIVEIN